VKDGWAFASLWVGVSKKRETKRIPLHLRLTIRYDGL